MTIEKPTQPRNGWAEAAFALGVCGFLAGLGLTLTGHDGTAGLISGLCLVITARTDRSEKPQEP